MDTRGTHQVLAIRQLTDSTFVIRIQRDGFQFIPGQHVNIGLVDEAVNREYSSYSSPNQEYLEFIIKEVADGLVSPRMKQLQPGDQVSLDGPFGLFTLPEPENKKTKYLFIGTGTGIAPFHSFITSYPQLNYQIVHGIRYAEEKYDYQDYDPKRYTACVSRETSPGDFHGRVTDYFLKHPLKDPQVKCYLCGNSAMINDIYDILREQGVNGTNIITEVFF